MKVSCTMRKNTKIGCLPRLVDFDKQAQSCPQWPNKLTGMYSMYGNLARIINQLEQLAMY